MIRSQPTTAIAPRAAYPAPASLDKSEDLYASGQTSLWDGLILSLIRFLPRRPKMYKGSEFSARTQSCSICRLPVFLTEAKTDEDGNAVHEKCYVSKLGIGLKFASSRAEDFRDSVLKRRLLKHYSCLAGVNGSRSPE